MPIYQFINTETNEVFEELMSISSKEEFLKNNPHISQQLTAPKVIAGVAGLTHKNDSGFNDVMSRIADANPYTPLAEKYGSKGITETKKRNAVKNVKKRLGM